MRLINKHRSLSRIAFILVLFLLSGDLSAQTRTTHITLKNGVVLIGQLKELDPLSHVVISIAGVDTRIEMGTVASIKEAEIESVKVENPIEEDLQIEEDPSNLPESFTFKIGDEEYEMVLIRGGDFQMGFDGRYSLEMKSEPIHPVRVGSFYINRKPVSNAAALLLMDRKIPFLETPRSACRMYEWEKAKKLVEIIAEKAGYGFRLPTEAEWEYMATVSNGYKLLDWKNDERNWCLDYFGEYPSSEKILLNPTGPIVGKTHVVREFDFSFNEIYRRRDRTDMLDNIFVRFVLPAKQWFEKEL